MQPYQYYWFVPAWCPNGVASQHHQHGNLQPVHVLPGAAEPATTCVQEKKAKLNDVAALKERLIACQPDQVQDLLVTSNIKLRGAGYTMLIGFFGKRADIAKAKKVFEAIPDPNVWHHTALIAAYATNGDWLKAVQHLQELKGLAANNPELRPNTITYSTAIEACARSQHMDVACTLWGEMVAAGIEPDSVTYAILLTHFSRGCDWDQVDALLQEMHAKGMAARTAIYTAFIRQLCRTNQWNKALGLYLVMRDLGADITPAMYTDLLQVLSAAGKPLMVSQLLQEAREDGTPNTNDLLDTSLAALLSAGFYTEAKTLHDRMVESGWQPSTILPEDPAASDTSIQRTSSTNSLAYSVESCTSDCGVPPAAAKDSAACGMSGKVCIPAGECCSASFTSSASSLDSSVGDFVTRCDSNATVSSACTTPERPAPSKAACDLPTAPCCSPEQQQGQQAPTVVYVTPAGTSGSPGPYWGPPTMASPFYAYSQAYAYGSTPANGASYCGPYYYYNQACGSWVPCTYTAAQ